MYGTHLIDQIQNKSLRGDGTLYVIGVCSNPVRFHSRYRIAREWIKAMAGTANVKLTVVEGAFGDRQHELALDCEAVGADYYPIRTHSEIWIKENMINLGARATIVKYPSCKYLAWIDMDVFFRNADWAFETVHQLQHFQVVQPWSDCADLGPQGNVFQNFKSFGHQHQRRIPKQKWPGDYLQYAHSGFAWACTRKFWEGVQGLMDFPILGSSDHHMAFGMIGEVNDTIHGKMKPSFFRKCREWEAKAVRITKKEVGFLSGRIEHWFHGPKKRRYYRERWDILHVHGFDPDTDLIYDDAGVLQLVGKPALEHDIHLYNLSRMEDSIEQD